MGNQSSPSNIGAVVSIRGSVVDIRFEAHLPPAEGEQFDQQHLGIDFAISGQKRFAPLVSTSRYRPSPSGYRPGPVTVATFLGLSRFVSRANAQPHL